MQKREKKKKKSLLVSFQIERTDFLDHYFEEVSRTDVLLHTHKTPNGGISWILKDDIETPVKIVGDRTVVEYIHNRMKKSPREVSDAKRRQKTLVV